MNTAIVAFHHNHHEMGNSQGSWKEVVTQYYKTMHNDHFYYGTPTKTNSPVFAFHCSVLIGSVFIPLGFHESSQTVNGTHLIIIQAILITHLHQIMEVLDKIVFTIAPLPNNGCRSTGTELGKKMKAK